MKSISVRDGVPYRKKPQGWNYIPIPKKEVDITLLERVIKGEISSREAAEQAGVGRELILKRIKEVAGYGMMQKRVDEADAKNKIIYEEYMAGAMCKDLAVKYGTTRGNMQQMIRNYRRKKGLPAKRKYEFRVIDLEGVE